MDVYDNDRHLVIFKVADATCAAYTFFKISLLLLFV